MIYGIGNDIIEIERIEKAISKDGFKKKVYTNLELESLAKKGNRVESYAGIFSAKEAISKALGTGVREFSLLDMEILNDDLGKPYVTVSEKLNEIIEKKFDIKKKERISSDFNCIEDIFQTKSDSIRKASYKIEISISHSKKYSTAAAVIFSFL